MVKEKEYGEVRELKYPMQTKIEKPEFNFLVQENGEYDYYLYGSFDAALKKAIALSFKNGIGLVFEIAFDNEIREYRGHNTFTVFDGVVRYDKHANIGLHIQFYVNAGEWLNSKEE